MLKVQITTAVELTDKQSMSMEKALKAKLADSGLVFEYKVDPNVLGGLRVIVGSREFDRTLRTRLEQIRQNLSAQQ
jgi:F0F1-type ATP synthase delta subunit